MWASGKFHYCDLNVDVPLAPGYLSGGRHGAGQRQRTFARSTFRASEADTESLRGRQQKAPPAVPFRRSRGSRLRDLRMRSGRRSGRRAAGGAAGPDRAQCVRRRDQCRRDSRSHRPQKLRRQGSRHRPTGLDYGKGRQANWRGIRYCHAALAADAFRRGEPARQRRGAAAGRAGAKPRRRCRRGIEGRLARIVVSAEDQHPLADAQRSGGAGADAASCLGRGPAGLFHSRRQGSAFS